MATVTASSVILYDNWPGPAREIQQVPKDGFDSAECTGVTVPAYRLGEKVCVYDSTSEGMVTFIYLKNTGAASTAVGSIVAPDGTSLYEVDTDPDSGTDITYAHGFCAVAVAVVEQNEYGWFWCGGPPPQDSKYGCSTLAATGLATNGGVANGDAGLMLIDATGSIQFDTWTGDRRPVGIALATDA
jgi:hypothetical protein